MLTTGSAVIWAKTLFSEEAVLKDSQGETEGRAMERTLLKGPTNLVLKYYRNGVFAYKFITVFITPGRT
jgi:hypothetical protein